ncbi:hypothetical protein [Corynebacterium heidelbergense]|uniref:Uncharacterized protein n=1 Tax=Corynebacterium heidelbergense TaxID=2055947 RepID=A0A364VB00_9CORY|nr:hypothetical protein [Corynebacterium heidelbergense]RAV33778.1 hypothetical protein CWC39_06610 [Corynebacterium heidelbergense]WCZ36546.1 hypothetical protein CHEID_05020 [Corynebacterium heidelbergense]
MSHPQPALLAEQLWSPVQNSALWLAWWLHGLVATDAVIDAVNATQSSGAEHQIVFPDAREDLARARSLHTGVTEVLRAARAATAQAPTGVAEQPLVSLVLAGPGQVPPLPANTPASRAVSRRGAGLLLAGGDSQRHHVVVPSASEGLVTWEWFQVEGPLPAVVAHSPGEAEELLRQAVEQAASQVSAAGVGRVGGMGGGGDTRLAVGTLADAFGLPGLPPGVPPRAERLMARADMVAAIVAVARRSEVGAGADPYVLPLLRAVRTARMVAVDYAQREIVR